MSARQPSLPGDATDAALFGAIAGGDLSALGMLFERYHEAVRSVALHAGVARGDLDDAVQDTFLRLAATAPRYDGRPHARPWVLATAWRVASDRRRALRRWVQALSRLATQAPYAARPTPEEDRLHAERWSEFAARVQALPARMRAAYVLVEVHELSCDEAAQALEVPVATIWTRLHHARKRMLTASRGGLP